MEAQWSLSGSIPARVPVYSFDIPSGPWVGACKLLGGKRSKDSSQLSAAHKPTYGKRGPSLTGGCPGGATAQRQGLQRASRPNCRLMPGCRWQPPVAFGGAGGRQGETPMCSVEVFPAAWGRLITATRVKLVRNPLGKRLVTPRSEQQWFRRTHIHETDRSRA